MSRLDFVQQKALWLKIKQSHQKMVDLPDALADQNKIDNAEEEAIDLNEWIAIFEEDQVKIEGCR